MVTCHVHVHLCSLCVSANSVYTCPRKMPLNLHHIALLTAQNPDQVHTGDWCGIQSQGLLVAGEGVLCLPQPLIMGYHTPSFL